MLEPYYSKDGIQIYNTDCMVSMQSFQDKSFDLLLTDPPYGINITKDHYFKNKYNIVNNWDNERPHKKFFDEMFRLSINQIIFGANYFIDYLMPTRCMLVWDKRGNINPDSYGDCEIAWTSFNKVSMSFTSRWKGFIRDSREKIYHPTQKALQVFTWCINDFSSENDIILDPFMGSGTTLVAAKKLGRKAIGIEISKKYCDIAIARLEDRIYYNESKKESENLLF